MSDGIERISVDGDERHAPLDYEGVSCAHVGVRTLGRLLYTERISRSYRPIGVNKSIEARAAATTASLSDSSQPHTHLALSHSRKLLILVIVARSHSHSVGYDHTHIHT